MHLHVRLNLDLPWFAPPTDHLRVADLLRDLAQRIRQDTGEIKGTVVGPTGDTLARYWTEE